MDEVKSVKYKRSPLVQGGLEIPVENVHWQDKRALEIKEKNRRTEQSSRGDRGLLIKRNFKRRIPVS